MTNNISALLDRINDLKGKFRELFLSHSQWDVVSSTSGAKICSIDSGPTVSIVSEPEVVSLDEEGLLCFVNKRQKVSYVYSNKDGVLWSFEHAGSNISPKATLRIEKTYKKQRERWVVETIKNTPAEILSAAVIRTSEASNNEKPFATVTVGATTKSNKTSSNSSVLSSQVYKYTEGIVLYTHYFKDKDIGFLLAFMNSQGMQLRASKEENVKVKPLEAEVDIENLMDFLLENNLRLISISGKNKQVLEPSEYLFDFSLADIDYTPCRLPKLDKTQLSDPEQGLWELWGKDYAKLAGIEYVARDPSRDIKHQAIAIDFGTSSTVVAMLNESGGRELLRIGVRDFFQPIEAKHFENPTVLEFLDYAAFSEVWGNQAYRPSLNWNWIRASHEAQVSYRDNPGNTEVLASILPKLKQWALRSTEAHQLSLTGRKGKEIKIPHHSERNPLLGQELQVSADDPLDPIELYAWYLGMTINWRGRGIFLKYYLSFPVKYSREVRERMSASFRRGLQRSLPYSLIQHYPEVLNEFLVIGLANEPAAYAAAAMEHLGIEPSEEGVPYAVFDFGGGTSDFDFGLLRWATEEEEDRGYERVFEQLATSGDNVLGGENLLEQLVYASFLNNLDELRKKKVQFTLPLETRPFPGSETFLAASQAAQTNSVMLSAKLRDFMEGEDVTLSSQIKLDLLDVNGSKQSCELALDAEQLDELLKQRIIAGVRSFMHQLKRVLNQFPVNQSIHVLLAGNGSRSRHLQILTDQKGEAWQQLCEEVFGGHCPDIKIYPAIESDENEPFAPTGKTGVALGLLALTPGKGVMLRCLTEETDGQAPFGWYVGRMRRGKFTPAIEPGQSYADWVEVGPLQEGHIDLYSTSSPRAMTEMKAGDAELRMRSLHFVGASEGSKLFVRCTGPNSIELQAGESANENSESIQALNFV